jgi:membrane-bound lytic murein transglycosylase A
VKYGWHGTQLRLLWLGCLLLVTLLLGCSRRPARQVEAKPPPAPPHGERLQFTDDLDRQSLLHSLQDTLEYIRRLPPERLLPLSARQITVNELRQTLEAFQKILQTTRTDAAFQQAVHEQFEVVQAAGLNERQEVLFTGYHEIVLEGSLTRTANFPYPLYRRPDDLMEMEPDQNGTRQVVRWEKDKTVAYFTRREIDLAGKLRGRGLELLWLPSAIDGFFLHVQGSGVINLTNGQTIRVKYDASNGHTYQSIARLLIEEGRLARTGISAQSLRRYFYDHPQEQSRVLPHNPRYIFFRHVEQGPQGNLGIILTPWRSIATDQKIFPAAGLAFIQAQKPVLNAQGAIVSWQSFSRFVLNHDVGSAITGSGRVDMFCGSNAEAEMVAGHMQHMGKLFFLVKRRS